MSSYTTFASDYSCIAGGEKYMPGMGAKGLIPTLLSKKKNTYSPVVVIAEYSIGIMIFTRTKFSRSSARGKLDFRFLAIRD